MNSPAPRYPAGHIASLSEALAKLCLRADDADAALDAVIGQLRPTGRPGLARRLWGRLPGDSRPVPDHAAPDHAEPDHAATLRRLIAEADARRIAIAALAAQAEAMASGQGTAPLLAAAEAARAAEQRRAEAGRRALHELLPLSRP